MKIKTNEDFYSSIEVFADFEKDTVTIVAENSISGKEDIKFQTSDLSEMKAFANRILEITKEIDLYRCRYDFTEN